MSAKLRALEQEQQEKLEPDKEQPSRAHLSLLTTPSLFPPTSASTSIRTVPSKSLTRAADTLVVPNSTTVNVLATVTLNGLHSSVKVEL